MKVRCKVEIVGDQPRCENSDISHGGPEAVPPATFRRQQKEMFRAPVQHRRRCPHAFLPEPSGRFLQALAVRDCCIAGFNFSRLRIQPCRHHRAKSKHPLRFATAFRMSVRLRQLPKRENQIENVTEPLKAMAYTVKAKKAQFVGWREKPSRNALELRRLCPIPG